MLRGSLHLKVLLGQDRLSEEKVGVLRFILLRHELVLHIELVLYLVQLLLVVVLAAEQLHLMLLLLQTEGREGATTNTFFVSAFAVLWVNGHMLLRLLGFKIARTRNLLLQLVRLLMRSILRSVFGLLVEASHLETFRCFS